MTADTPSPLAPKLRFPEFQDAPGWPRRLIGRYLSQSRIKGSGGHEARKLTVKLWGKGVFEKHASLQGGENTQYYRRRAGQFIYSKLDFLNQAFGIIPDHLDGFESTVDLPCFDIAPELNAKFLLEYVQREPFYKIRGEIADGRRKAKRVQVQTFLECPIYSPSKREQRKVADCLASLDDLIAAKGRKLEALRQHKRGLIQQLFPQPGESVPRLRFPQFQNAPEWSLESIDEFAETTTGKKDTQDKVNGGSNPFFVRSHSAERIDTHAYNGEAVLTSGDGVGVGKDFHYIDGKFDFHKRVYCIHQFKSHVLGRFFFFYFSEHFGPRVRRMSEKNSLHSVRRSMITDMPVPLPDPSEQKTIADCLSAHNTLIDAQVAELDTLRTHKQGLLQKLFPPLEGQ